MLGDADLGGVASAPLHFGVGALEGALSDPRNAGRAALSGGVSAMSASLMFQALRTPEMGRPEDARHIAIIAGAGGTLAGMFAGDHLGAASSAGVTAVTYNDMAHLGVVDREGRLALQSI